MVAKFTDGIWSRTLRHFLLPAGDRVFGQNLTARLTFLENAQWWHPKFIARERDASLRSLIKIAYQEVPFYQDLMDRSGVHPSDIQTREDLARIPIVTKDMLRDGYPERTTRRTQQQPYEAWTSGSTGKNFCVLEDAETAGRYRAIFLLALEWAGWPLGARHLQTGINPQRSVDRRIKDLLMRCHYVSAFDLRDHQLNQSLNKIDRYQIQFLMGYPGGIYMLAKYAQRVGWERKLKAVVTWGDNLFKHYRETIESVFKTRVYDTYGCAEGIQVSAQCQFGLYHIHALDTIVEIVDDDGQYVPPGELGNIILTRLHPGPMPLIRYQIGDLGVRSGDLLCECGRGFPIMKSINGRDTDIIHTPGGNRLLVHFFTGILEHYPEIDSFQVVQETIDSLVIRILPINGYSDRSTENIKAQLKRSGARDMKIDVRLVDSIPLPASGKHRFIISRHESKS